MNGAQQRLVKLRDSSARLRSVIPEMFRFLWGFGSRVAHHLRLASTQAYSPLFQGATFDHAVIRTL
jgi:hypothetical protein